MNLTKAATDKTKQNEGVKKKIEDNLSLTRSESGDGPGLKNESGSRGRARASSGP